MAECFAIVVGPSWAQISTAAANMAVCDAKGRRASMPWTQRAEPQQRASASVAASRESPFSDGNESVTEVAPHAQATHAAVGENTQAQVRGFRTPGELAHEEVPSIRR